MAAKAIYFDHILIFPWGRASMKATISIERLREIIDYDPQTGFMIWKPRTAAMFDSGVRSAEARAKSFNTLYAGKPALQCKSSHGYFYGRIYDRAEYAHRVAFALHNGFWPLGVIDHIDGDRTNNAASNLRDVLPSENLKNAKRQSNNKSGHTGVFFQKDIRKWVSYLHHNGEKIHLGCFSEMEDAINARDRAAPIYGFTVRHGS